MNPKELIVEKLNEVIYNFEESSKIVNYAIIFDSRIVLSPNTTDFTKENVAEIRKKLEIEKYEKNFQKGTVNSLLVEFEKGTIFYLMSAPKVRIIAAPKNIPIDKAREKLLKFAEDIKKVIETLSKPASDETNKEISQSLALLETIIDEFQIPKFDEFKRLVKFAVPFKKKE